MTARWTQDAEGNLVADVTDGVVPPIHFTVTGGAPHPALVADFGQYTRALPNDYDPTRPPIDLGVYGMGGGSSAGAVTEVIPAVPQDAPRLDVGPGPAAEHTTRPGFVRSLVNAAAVGVFGVACFLGGQWTTQNGLGPVLPLPAAEVETAVQTARLWQLGTPAEHTQQCGWLAAKGDTRDYVLAYWVRHLGRPEGGRLRDVDRATVARTLDNACAGRAPAGKG